MPDRPVYYFARMVPGYRVPVLERLNQRLNGRLIVCAGQPPGTSSLNYLMSEKNCSFRQVALRNWWFYGEKIHVQPFHQVFREFGPPAVVLAEESPRSVTLPLLLSHARRRGAGRVLWGHFSSLNRPFDPETYLQDRYRVALARRAEACACYTDGVADLLRPYVPEEKLFVARNTIEIDPMLRQRDALAKEGKRAVRRRLSMSEQSSVLVYVGRLIPEKGTALLLEGYRMLQAEGPAELIVIGDGPERPKMQSFVSARNLRGVRFLGPISNDEAAPYLYASDVMVMPGYLGLVINHAFAFGLPVVSMREPAGITSHSPEVEYVESGETGILCEGETPEDLVFGIRFVLNDLTRFSANALAFARSHLTIDRMVDGLYGAIGHAGRRYGYRLP